MTSSGHQWVWEPLYGWVCSRCVGRAAGLWQDLPHVHPGSGDVDMVVLGRYVRGRSCDEAVALQVMEER